MTAGTPGQESRRRAGVKDYKCGLCGGEFGSNCRPGDIECTECEARLCPCCGTWFTELGEMSEPHAAPASASQVRRLTEQQGGLPNDARGPEPQPAPGLLAEILGSFVSFGRHGQFRRCVLSDDEYQSWCQRAEPLS